MKIPTKKSINSLISEQRRAQIDEGMTLARKVDALREDFLRLQRQRTDFIEQSKLELDKELTPFRDEKAKLVSEIETLEEIKVKLKDIIEHGISR